MIKNINREIRKLIRPTKCRHCVKIVAGAKLPTQFGDFKIVAFCSYDNKDHVAIIKGDITNKDVPCRIHSECLTGDVFGSKRCDCREQLVWALNYIEKEKHGIILYLHQEGRGIGLVNKIKAYHLQEMGYDTAEANTTLGFKEDLRDYKIAADMLKLLGIKSIQLITNNPKKIKSMEKNGIRITRRIPVLIKPNKFNKFYLETKKKKFGHFIE